MGARVGEGWGIVWYFFNFFSCRGCCRLSFLFFVFVVVVVVLFFVCSFVSSLVVFVSVVFLFYSFANDLMAGCWKCIFALTHTGTVPSSYCMLYTIRLPSSLLSVCT